MAGFGWSGGGGDAEGPSRAALLLAKASCKDSGVLAVVSGVIPAPVTQKPLLGVRPAWVMLQTGPQHPHTPTPPPMLGTAHCSAALPQTAGYVTPYKGLTLVSVHGAGHHVSYFKPRQALQMISAWLDDRLP